MQPRPAERDKLIIRAARPGSNDFGNGIAELDPKEISVDTLVESMEARVVSEGPLEGENFQVIEWQRDCLASVLFYRETLASMGRGNGKTTFFACLACEWLDGCLTWPRAKIVLVASSLNQGRVCFDHIKYFMGEDRLTFEKYTPKPSEHNTNPQSVRRWRMSDNAHQCRIEDKKTGVVLTIVGSDSKRAHGLAPTVVLADEPAQWLKGGRKLFNALIGGLGKQPNAKIFVFGTLPENDFHWFVKRIKKPNEHRQCLLFQADKDADPFDQDQWHLANPSLIHMPKLLEAIEADAADAADDEEDLASFKAYRLNLGVAELVEREPLISAENWAACVVPDHELPPRAGPMALTIDLGGGVSMSAAAGYWPETGRAEAWGAFPAEPKLKKRGIGDAVGTMYVKMKNRGEIKTYPGISTNNGLFLEDVFKELEDETIFTVVCDRHKETDTRQAVALSGKFLDSEIEWRPVGQGPSGSYDVRAFRQECLEGHLKSKESLLIEHALSEAVVDRNTNGNEALNKARAKGRIDVAQALILAAGAGRRHRYPESDDLESQRIRRYYEQALEQGTPLITHL